jgi:hypothetical protein
MNKIANHINSKEGQRYPLDTFQRILIYYSVYYKKLNGFRWKAKTRL